MRWRSIVLAALGVGFGIAAGLCIQVETRVYAAIDAVFATGDSGLSTAQSASIGTMFAQVAALSHFVEPLVAGFLVCVVALLVVLAWRWQAPSRDA